MRPTRMWAFGPTSAWAVALTATIGCDEPLPCQYAPQADLAVPMEADMRAAVDMPQLSTFSCRCLDQFGVPIAGATVTLGGRSTTSGADGSFTLTEVPVSARVITVDATSVPPPAGQLEEVSLSADIGAVGERRYGKIAEEVTLQPGTTTGREQAFVVPLSTPLGNVAQFLDDQNVVTAEEGFTVTGDSDGYDPAVEAAQLFIAKGTKITFPPGVGKGLSITRVPPGLAAGTLATGAGAPLVVMIQPIGTTFSPPARLILPTVSAAPIGQKQEFQELSLETGRYVAAGTGTVAEGDDYREVRPDADVRVSQAGYHLTLCPPVTIQGQVLLGGTPRAGIGVEARNIDSIEEDYSQTYSLARASTLTGADGRYSLTGIRTCTPHLLARSESDQGFLGFATSGRLINLGQPITKDLLLLPPALRRFNLRVRVKRPGEPAQPFPDVGVYTSRCLAGDCYQETNSLGEVLFRDLVGTPEGTVDVELCGNRDGTITRQVPVPTQSPSPPACGLFQAADVVELNITTSCGSGS